MLWKRDSWSFKIFWQRDATFRHVCQKVGKGHNPKRHTYTTVSDVCVCAI